MRRSEKEIRERSGIDGIIHATEVCRLGLCDHGRPYVVPLNFGYDGEVVYFHCAPEGRKLEILRENNRVCLEFDIPEGLVRGEQACNWGMRYRSVLAFGTAREVADPGERLRGLQVIMSHYSDERFSFPPAMVERTTVIRVDIETITGKQSPPSS
ncbi:MAG: pyridoxamine 5'-phosphate oxidase family protein [Spirochaetaceae bacterium]|nr:MAG: pyridoxamine 5'-phosphate oxidase family protein [Spirochaetaceae bacterium]